jgi:hypothetical protein
MKFICRLRPSKSSKKEDVKLNVFASVLADSCIEH